MNLKTIAVMLLLVLAFSLLVSPAFAGVTDTVKQSWNQQTLKQEVDDVATNIVNFIRGIFGVVAVILVVWMGVMALSSDPNRILILKKLAAGFIICLILVFAAEKVVGGILGILGFQMPQ